VGDDWDIVVPSVTNAIVGPASSTDDNFVVFDGSSGKLAKDSGYGPTTLGVITTGTWNADSVDIEFGGTGLSSIGTPGQFLAVNSGATELIWQSTTAITALGTITTGTWNATTIATSHGGTGLTSMGTAGQILAVNSGATGLAWESTTAITALGTIATGIWQATTVGVAYGGTGLTSLGTANQVLCVNSGGTALTYVSRSLLPADSAGLLFNSGSGASWSQSPTVTGVVTAGGIVTGAGSGILVPGVLESNSTVISGNPGLYVVGGIVATGALSCGSFSTNGSVTVNLGYALTVQGAMAVSNTSGFLCVVPATFSSTLAIVNWWSATSSAVTSNVPLVANSGMTTNTLRVTSGQIQLG
jgi:hypothetical protein